MVRNNPPRSRSFRKTIRLTVLCAAAVLSVSHAANPLYSQFASRLGGKTVLNASPDALVTAVGEQIGATPKQAPRVVSIVLASGRADNFKIAPSIIAVAIASLDKPTPEAVGEIVAAAVRATPSEVIAIVKTAIHAAPGQANADAIIAAATRSVPDPKEKIRLRAQMRDYKSDGKDDPNAIGEPMPLDQALIKTAMEADPSLNPGALQAAAVAAPGAPVGPNDISKFDLVSRLGGGGNVSAPTTPPPPQPVPVIQKQVSP